MKYLGDTKVYVVLCHFSELREGWDVCDFANKPFMSTSYYEAHILKRAIQEYLQKTGSKSWTKKKFKVVEFVPKK